MNLKSTPQEYTKKTSPCFPGWVCFFSSWEKVHGDIWDWQAWHGRPHYNFLQGDCCQNILWLTFVYQVGGRAAKMRDKLAQMGYTGVQVFHPPMLHTSHDVLIENSLWSLNFILLELFCRPTKGALQSGSLEGALWRSEQSYLWSRSVQT